VRARGRMYISVVLVGLGGY